MKPIDISNCCYPEEVKRVYKIKASFLLHMKKRFVVDDLFLLSPGQNIESAVLDWVIEQVKPTQVFYSHFRLIKEI